MICIPTCSDISPMTVSFASTVADINITNDLFRSGGVVGAGGGMGNRGVGVDMEVAEDGRFCSDVKMLNTLLIGYLWTAAILLWDVARTNNRDTALTTTRCGRFVVLFTFILYHDHILFFICASCT